MLWKNNQFFTDIPFPKVKDRPLIVSPRSTHELSRLMERHGGQ